MSSKDSSLKFLTTPRRHSHTEVVRFVFLSLIPSGFPRLSIPRFSRGDPSSVLFLSRAREAIQLVLFVSRSFSFRPRTWVHVHDFRIPTTVQRKLQVIPHLVVSLTVKFRPSAPVSRSLQVLLLDFTQSTDLLR
ncbi:hypothetical protein VTJ04DRAFT_1270 [Mycothermus thermophilus]|uniref:uncharacterized protein n=1 Tax=Humicola insolens TaxID=85995 RepID=UPI00374263F4